MKQLSIYYIAVGTALLALGSCDRQSVPEGEGQVIRFSAEAPAPSGASDTRTLYSGEVVNGKERIEWVAGDRISVYCPDAAETKTASYSIPGEIHAGVSSYATTLVGVNGQADLLKWGTASSHRFYGRYPDPSWSDAPSENAFRSQPVSSTTFTCVIPATQVVTQEGTSSTYKPDMAYCYMTAYTTASPGANVTLPFTPAVSTFEITIPVKDGGLAALISSVSLVSTSHRLNGTYTVTIGATPSYTVNESSLTDADKRVSVQFATPVWVKSGSSLTLTLFTCPVTMSDLSVRIVFSDGKARNLPLKVGSTWLSYAPCGKYCINCGALEPAYPFTTNSSGHQVVFSLGNLQYIGSAATPYWKFADHQWDILGTTTGQNSDATNVDRDLFGWATSGYNNKYPYMTSSTSSDYGPDISSGEWTSDSNQWDWGVHNIISNGGGYSWRMLTNDEWAYLIEGRSCSPKYAGATVAGVVGLILFPDVYNHPSGVAAINKAEGSRYSDNVFDATAWTMLEQAGCVFLPAAGQRRGITMYESDDRGYYWSSTARYSYGACYMYIYDGCYDYPDPYDMRFCGYSVRLIRDLN